jgi:PAS domain-containing protein
VTGSVACAKRGEVARFNAYGPTAKGTPKWWDVTVTPITDASGDVVSVLSVSRDITELHLAKVELRETAARMRFVLETAQLGDWELDLATGRARTSVLHDQCFGLSESAVDWTYERFMAYVHPDDRAFVSASLDAVQQTFDDWQFECRVIWDDRTVHWISAHGRFYGPDGKRPTRLLGSVTDITERKLADQELRTATQMVIENVREAEIERRRLNALLDATPIGISYANHRGQLVTTNAALRDIWGNIPCRRPSANTPSGQAGGRMARTGMAVA